MSPLLLLPATAFAAALAGTGLARRYALARRVLDHPGARSSHKEPTPRGGGIAIAAAFVGAVAAAWVLGMVPGRIAGALAGGGAAVAALGWLDDHAGLSVRVRLPVQVAAAAAAVWAAGGLPALQWGPGAVPLGAAGAVLAVLAVIWSLNLFNFMDGIDGMAAAEAISLGGWGGALLLAEGHAGLAALAFGAGAAAAGFLPWNWPRARIFMGDVGSATLGFVFAVLALASENAGAVPLLAWATLYALFLVDATATLVRRALRGERVYEAHRLHAYQRLVQAGWPHARVTGVALGVNAVLAVLAGAGTRVPELLLPAFVAGIAVASALYIAVERVSPMHGR